MRFARIRIGSDLLFARLGDDGAHVLRGPPWASRMETGRAHPFTPSELACPVTPSKIICIGRNYVGHAKEMGAEPPKEPLLFLKPPSALLDPGGAIVLPAASDR